MTCNHVPSAAKCLFYKKWKDTLHLEVSVFCFRSPGLCSL